MPRIPLALLLTLCLAGLSGTWAMAAGDGPAAALPENDAVKILGTAKEPCEAPPHGECLRVRVECKLKRRVSNWSKSLVRMVWVDAGGARGQTASKGFDSCRHEVGERFDLFFVLPPPGLTYALELP